MYNRLQLLLIGIILGAILGITWEVISMIPEFVNNYLGVN